VALFWQKEKGWTKKENREKGKVKKSKRWGNEGTRGKRGAPARCYD